MQINFRATDGQSCWVWTDGLQTLGQQEVAVMVPWPESDPRNKLAIDLLKFIESYITEQAKRILPEQAMRYGWTTLRFMSDKDNLSGLGLEVLLIEELQNPFAQEDLSYVPGISNTLALLDSQHRAIRRNRVTGEAVYPHRSQRAMVCTRVTPKTIQHLRPLMANRCYEPDTHDSGWFFGCCDQDHDHDNPDELEMIHLHHLVEQFPGLLSYLGMPRDTMLVFEEYLVIVFRPGEQEGQPDPDSVQRD